MMRIHGHDSAPLAERDKVGNSATAAATGAEQAVRAEAKAGSLVGAAAVMVSAGASEAALVASRDRSSHLDRVAKVKTAVRDGTYRVDLDRLTQKFIDEELAGPRR